MITKGTRVYGLAPHEMKPGEYGIWDDQGWYGVTPNGHGCNLNAHTIWLHEDGHITCAPSIAVSIERGTPAWHGYLEHGMWREV